MGFFDLLCTVLGGVRYGDNILTFIGAHSVVEDDISEDPDLVVMESPDCLEIFLFGAVFGADSILLVEFAQVVHVVDAVADVFLGCPLICRRKPYIRDADSVQALCLGGALDGIPEMPRGMRGVQDMVMIYEAMLRQGWSEDLVRDIFYRNLRNYMERAI